MRIRSVSMGSAGGFDFEAMRVLGLASMGSAGVGECLAAVGRIRRDDIASWTTEFAALGARLVAEGESWLTRGDAVSAAQCLRRASTYYRAAAFYITGTDPRRDRFRALGRELYQRALAVHPAGVEVLRIPYADTWLPGYFVSAGDEPHPTLVVVGGYDSTAEELMAWIGESCAAHGWNALVFEGPGQPGTLSVHPGLVFRPDYEVPVGAALDHIIVRPDVDPSRIALLGYSFGGCLAPRAAARDSRIGAVVANTIGVDIAAALRMALPAVFWKLPPSAVNATFEAFARLSPTARFFLDSGREAFGVRTPTEFLTAWEPYQLWDVVDLLRVPVLVLLGEDEIAEASEEVLIATLDFLEQVPAPVSLRTFSRADGGSAHCQLDSPERMPPVLFDWLEAVLPVGPPALDAVAEDAAWSEAVRLIRMHHGHRLDGRLGQVGGRARELRAAFGGRETVDRIARAEEAADA